MIGSNVISLFRPRSVDRDWNNQELAEFYRVESSLITVGFHVDTERGLSDEGDPWFVFVDATSGDVIVHCARTDGAYLIASAAFEGVLRGVDFRALVESFLDRQPLALPRIETPEQRNNIHLHPSAFLVALVATAFFKLSSTSAEAAVLGDGDGGHDPYGTDADGASDRLGMELDKRQSLVVLAAVAVVTGQAISDVTDVSGMGASARFLSDSDAPVEGRSGASATLPTFVEKADGPRLTDPINGIVVEEPEPLSSSDTGSGSIFSAVLADVLFGDAPLDLSAVELKAGGGVVSEGGGSGLALASLGQALLDFSGSALDMSSMGHAVRNLSHHSMSSTAEETRKADTDSLSLTSIPASETSARTVTPAVQFLDAQGLERGDGLSSGGQVSTTMPQPGKEVPPADEQPYIPPETTSGIDLQRLLHSVAGELDVKVGQVRIDGEVRTYDDDARALILDFVQQEDDRRTFSSGHDLIVYDSRLSDVDEKNISFVTWTLDNGATISLLGVIDYDQVAA